jgi:hypothetical protein
VSNYTRALLLICILGFGLAHAQKAVAPKTAAKTTPPPEEFNRLPVQRVVLYKNGVGYFEHSARVRGKQELNIDFTTSQLNDVLKSLTVVDLGDGRISSVRYNSIAPLSERLKVLRLPFGEQIDRDNFSRCPARCPRRSSQRLGNSQWKIAERRQNEEADRQG